MSSQPSEKAGHERAGKKVQRAVLLLLIGLPILIAGMTLAGTFLGFYLRRVFGTGDLILPVILSVLFLGIAIALSYVITSAVSSRAK